MTIITAKYRIRKERAVWCLLLPWGTRIYQPTFGEAIALLDKSLRYEGWDMRRGSRT